MGSVFFKVDAKFIQLDKALRDIQRTEQAANRTKGAVGGLSGAFKALGLAAAAVSAIQVTKGFIAVADRAQQLENRLRAVTGSTEELTMVYGKLNAISRKTGTVVANNAQLYQRLALSADSLGATNEELLAVTETITNLGRVSGSTAEDIKNSSRQLGQAFGSNFFRAEEFNSVIEQMPAVISTIAREMGITNAELNLMVKNGKLLSKDAFEALLRGQQKAREDAAKLPLTYEESMNKVKNATLIASNEINKMIGLTSILGGAAGQVGDLMQMGFGLGSTAARDLNTDLETGRNTVIVIAALFKTLGEAGTAVFKAIGMAAVDGNIIIIKSLKEVFDYAMRGYDQLRQAASKVPGFGGLATNEEIGLKAKIELEALDARILRTQKRAMEAKEAFEQAFDSTPGGISTDSALGKRVLETERAFQSMKDARQQFVKENQKGLQAAIMMDSGSVTNDVINSLQGIKKGFMDVADAIVDPFETNYDILLAKSKAFAAEQERILGDVVKRIETGSDLARDSVTGQILGLMDREKPGVVKLSNPLLDQFNELTANTNITKINNLKDAIKDAESFLAEFGSSFDADGVANIKDSITLLRQELALLGPSTGFVFGDNFIQGINSAFDTLGSSVSDNLVGKLFGEESSFKDIARNFVKSILSTMLEELIFSPIVKSIQEAWGRILNPEQPTVASAGGTGIGGAGGIFSLLGGLGGGGGPLSILGSIGNAFTPSTAASVGTPASVMNASNTANNSVTYNITTPDVAGFQVARGRIKNQSENFMRNN